MKNLSRLALLSAVALQTLGGCNLTYDREGLEFTDGGGGGGADTEPNDTTATALPLTLGTPVTGQVGSDTDLDYYAFTVPPGGLDVRFQTFDATGVGCADVDPRITIYDSTSGYLSSEDDTPPDSRCEDLIVTLSEGTYYVAVSFSFYATPPFDYVVRTFTAAAGSSISSASCAWPTPYDYCEETTGLLRPWDLATLQSYCESYSGGYAPTPCPASAVAGYCDGGLTGYISGTTRHWIYDGSIWTQAGAQLDCTGTGYSWVGGACAAPTPDACTMGTLSICTDLGADERNCGQCNSVCEPGSSCTLGTCNLCGVTAGYQVCGTPESPVCVDTQNDPNHCGSCGTSCESRCVAGSCDPGGLQSEVELNDLPPGNPFFLGYDLQGARPTTSDVDYFSFVVPAGGRDVRFQTFDVGGRSCSGIDPWIGVYDAGGTQIGFSDSPGACEELVISLTTSGSYSVAVSGFTPGDYVLATTATAIGTGSSTSVSCEDAAQGLCEQVAGRLDMATINTIASNCQVGGGGFVPNACDSSGALAGHCDATLVAGLPGSYFIYYFPPFWSDPGASSDCAMLGGTWVP